MERVDHTHRVLDGIERVDRLMSDALADERGYLLTGRRAYLSHYDATTSEVGSDLGDLRELTRDNPVQQRRLDTLQSLASERLAVFHRMALLHDARGRDAAHDAPVGGAGDHGEWLESRYRELSERMAHTEQDLLAERVMLGAAQRQSLGGAMLGRARGAPVRVLGGAWVGRRAVREVWLV